LDTSSYYLHKTCKHIYNLTLYEVSYASYRHQRPCCYFIIKMFLKKSRRFYSTITSNFWTLS